MTNPTGFARRAASLAALMVFSASGCHDVTAPAPPGLVSISLKLQPATADGTPISVTITNSGKGTVLLGRRCNIDLMLWLQKYENGDWQWQGPAVACPNYPDIGPITLAPGESLQAESFAFSPGRYRVAVFAAPGDDSASAVMVPSGAVDIR
jgi:hypothetical protein